jgi:hypothetical protein
MNKVKQFRKNDSPLKLLTMWSFILRERWFTENVQVTRNVRVEKQTLRW